MKKEIFSSKAPKPIGPYSQGVMIGGFLFLSGQIPIDTEKGIVVGSNIEDQTEQVLKNILAILKEAGYGLEDVVKTTIFLKNINDFAGMNGVYEKYFKSPYPVRSTVEVSNLPRNVLVEIEAIAFKG